MKKKWFSLLLCIIMVITMIPTAALAEGVAIDPDVQFLPTGDQDITGSGTQEDPYSMLSAYNSWKKDTLTISTVDPAAKIDDSVGGKAFSLEYGMNDIHFTVTSADESKTIYCFFRYERRKQQQNATPDSGAIYGVAAATRNDGKIVGLDADMPYLYRLKGSADWLSCAGVTEITGLAEGTYQLKFGETADHYAADDSNNLEIYIGSSAQVMPIINDLSSRAVIAPESAAAGARISFKIALAENEWVTALTINNVLSGDWGSTTPLRFVFTGYTTEGDAKYYNGYFTMPSAYSANRSVHIAKMTTSTVPYYPIVLSAAENIVMTVTPKNADDVMTVNGVKQYKQDSEVEIAVSAQQSFGTSVLKSFRVVDSENGVIADSTDGSAVTVAVSGALTVTNVQLDWVYADFTALTAQVDRAASLDLTLYTDATRVIVEDKLAIAKNAYRLTQKDQDLADEITAELKDALDKLVPKAGDYSAVDAAIQRVPDAESIKLYTDETVDAVKQAVANVVRDKTRLEQAAIDGFAKAINDAVDALIYKDADYSRLDALLATIPADLSAYTEETVKALQDAKNAVVRNLNITKQDVVDGYAAALRAAINGLENKPIAYPFLTGTDGVYTRNADERYTVKVDAELEKLVSVAVDGALVDERHYRAESGSTSITFTKEYMHTLSVGSHAITVNFTDGAATTSLTVKEQAAATPTAAPTAEPTAAPTAAPTAEPTDASTDKNTAGPKTGDANHLALWMALLVSGGAVLALGIARKKRG